MIKSKSEYLDSVEKRFLDCFFSKAVFNFMTDGAKIVI